MKIVDYRLPKLVFLSVFLLLPSAVAAREQTAVATGSGNAVNIVGNNNQVNFEDPQTPIVLEKLGIQARVQEIAVNKSTKKVLVLESRLSELEKVTATLRIASVDKMLVNARKPDASEQAKSAAQDLRAGSVDAAVEALGAREKTAVARGTTGPSGFQNLAEAAEAAEEQALLYKYAESSIAPLQRAVSYEPWNPRWYVELGLAYVQSRNLRLALDTLSRAASTLLQNYEHVPNVRFWGTGQLVSLISLWSIDIGTTAGFHERDYPLAIEAFDMQIEFCAKVKQSSVTRPDEKENCDAALKVNRMVRTGILIAAGRLDEATAAYNEDLHWMLEASQASDYASTDVREVQLAYYRLSRVLTRSGKSDKALATLVDREQYVSRALVRHPSDVEIQSDVLDARSDLAGELRDREQVGKALEVLQRSDGMLQVGSLLSTSNDRDIRFSLASNHELRGELLSADASQGKSGATIGRQYCQRALEIATILANEKQESDVARLQYDARRCISRLKDSQ